MAKLALTIAGGVAGFLIGGPAGARLGMMLGGIAGSLLFGPSIKGPRLSDLDVTASTYGNAIPELFGTMRMSGNMIWSAGIKEHKHKSGVGGKGVGGSTTTYTYTCSFAIAFCKGEVTDVLRLWADGKLISGQAKLPTDLSVPQLIAITLGKGKAKRKYKFRIYKGTQDQEPDSIIEATKGVGNVPAYRDLCYIVFEDMPLDDFGNRIPQITAEVSKASTGDLPETTLIQKSPTITGTIHPLVAWGDDRFYRYFSDTKQLVQYDALSMTEVKRVTLADNSWGGTGTSGVKPQVVPGGTYFCDEIFASGGNNSNPIGIFSVNTGALFGTIGHPSNNLGDSPMSIFHDYSPAFANLNRFGSLFAFRVLTLSGQESYFINQGNTSGAMVMYNIDSLYPVYYGEGGFVIMRGQELVGSSQVLAYKNVNGSTPRLQVFTVAQGTLGHTVPDPDGFEFDFINGLAPVETSIGSPYGETEFQIVRWAYDGSDNSIVVWGMNAGGANLICAKYLLTEHQWKWKWKDTDYPGFFLHDGFNPGNWGFPAWDASTSSMSGGKFGWGALTTSSFKLWQADLSTGKIDWVQSYGGPNTGWSNMSWDDTSSSLMTNASRIYFRQVSGEVTVQSIVEEILQKTGSLSPADYDCSALGSISVSGYTISRDASAKDCLQQLAGAYFFDGVESDYKIKVKPRTGTPVGNITQKHLALVENRDVAIKETRAQELELPMRITVSYADAARDYQTGTQSSKRLMAPIPTMNAKKEDKFELPIVLTATEAKQITDKTLRMAWTNRVTMKNMLPWEFIKYDAADVVTVTMDDGTVHTLRIDKIDIGVNLSLDVQSVTESASAYVSTAVGSSGVIPVQNATEAGKGNLFILNTPLLRDTDDTQGVSSIFYIATAATTPGNFGNIYVFESDDGTDFQNKNILTSEVVHGYVVEALPNVSNWSAVDATTQLTVVIDNLEGTLETITDDQLLAGGNAALIGSEVIQFRDAVLNADGSYTISYLRRARRGTNYAVKGHAPGETFVLLNTANFITMNNPPAAWSATHYFKPVPPGWLAEDINSVGQAFEPNDLKPYTPENVNCTDDGTDVTIGFVRRSRITAELTDGTGDVPYREGQGSNAHFTYEVYENSTLTDQKWLSPATTPPEVSGTVPVFLPGGGYAPTSFTFPLGSTTQFVVVIREIGYVTGFPKVVQFDRVFPGDWNMTELY